MEFNELKELITQRCKGHGACSGEFKRVLESKDSKELLTVLKDNFAWSWEKVMDVDTLDLFGVELCSELEIYYKGEIEELKAKSAVILCGNVLVKMLDSSTVREMWDSSTVREMLGSSTVREMLGSSTVQKMWDSSTVREMWGSSTVREMWGSSTVREMLGSSTVQKMWDSSTVQKMLGSSTVREMLGSSTVRTCHELKDVQFNGDSFCIIDYSRNKIIAGNKFELEIVNLKKEE